MPKITAKSPSRNPEYVMFDFEYTKEMKDAGQPVVDSHPVKKAIADMFKVGEDYRLVSVRDA